ncbi:MAG: HAMP domain-containing sensor histidine kinase [Candidatus Pelagadaptatus aseana]|uniref:ATP-binding protein n=1 Tax=Candidatus Pelagadaptatus aseana TaxID=3120508 RepID=UPI0039B324AE
MTLWPKTLFPRMLLLIVLALLLAQGISLWVLSSAHRDVLRDQGNRFQLRQFISLVQLLEEIPESLHRDAADAWRRPGLQLGFYDESPVAPAQNYPALSLQQLVVDSLGEGYSGRVCLQLQQLGPRRSDGKYRHDDDDEHEFDDDDAEYHHHRRSKKPARELSVAVRLNSGRWFSARLHLPVIHPRFAYPTLVFIGSAVVLVLLVVFWQLRKITRPLRSLGEAAEALGRGQPVPALAEQGPEDIKQTLKAFNLMNRRIQRFVADRTQMLAALSHDLRTPITTMRLRLEMMAAGEQRDKLLESLDEMQQMSEAALAFARQSGDGEETCQVDLGALVGSLCDDLQELGECISFSAPSEQEILITKPLALKRALRNLLENAVRYGDCAEVALFSEVSGIRIVIQDHGPGIPEGDMASVFEPFVRLEDSRNRETGGVGLGLAIARQTVRSFGGDITLANRKQGLEVTVELPRH